MAFTERYVTSGAGGGGVGSEGDPWTYAEANTNAVSSDRVNMKSGAYSLGADTVSNAGTIFDPIVFRGYNTVIGDLQNPERSATTGKLVTTGFPAITLTGTLTPNAFVIFQNLAFTGALSASLIESSAADGIVWAECEVINTQNNAAARAIRGDNYCTAFNCDLECSGASHTHVVEFDAQGRICRSRIKFTGGPGVNFAGTDAAVEGNLFIGDGSSIAFKAQTSRNSASVFANNTFYNCGTILEFPDGAPTNVWALIYNNHATDSAKWIDDLYVATDSVPVLEFNNRTRDNTTPRTGVGDGVLSGEETEDTGGSETDYTNAGADNLSLISAAPGREAAIGQGSPDIGAWQGEAGAGGGAASILGAGGMLHGGMD